VPQHERLLEAGIADPGRSEPVQVRPANADGGDAQQFFARAGEWFRFVVEADIGWAVQPGNLHVISNPAGFIRRFIHKTV
jgi:hypothetical protein